VLTATPAAYFISNPPATVVTPNMYRTPEYVLLEGQVNSTLDVWAFGCLIYELLIGFPLFQVDPCRDKDTENDHHLLLFNDTLGPLPHHLYSLWSRSSRYYTSERVLFNTFLEEVPEGTDLLSAKSKPLEELFDEQRPDMSDSEAKQIYDLLRRILQYDPAKRPTPAELLKDPWFTS
jgi:non-specific serine/threonine protein kinase